jgi:pimeloyl-ACP methyl ester carboxylesterase
VLYGGSRPNGVRALSLTATPYPTPRPGPDPSARLDSVGRSFRGRSLGILVRAAWPAIAAPVALARHYPFAVVRDYGRQTLRGRSWTLWSLLNDPTVEADLDAAQHRLGPGPPVLLVHAADDRTVSVGAASAWARRFPAAERCVLPSGGHQVLLNTRFEPLVRWLESLPA